MKAIEGKSQLERTAAKNKYILVDMFSIFFLAIASG